MILKPRAVLAGRYPARIPQAVERAVVHFDQGDGHSLCYRHVALMIDDSYDPGPATCGLCIRRAERRHLTFSTGA
jgi:hypothetical protein